MQLREYRKWRGVTIVEIAEKTGQSINNVSRQERGLARVDALTREKYREATGGCVKPDDWHELELEMIGALKAASTTHKENAVHA